ncbi:hypothetical protein [Thermoactinomyces mirandus]|uniref:Uncharacterized protein n=1 Tax=Thermoactinomyces mirandus TaxID=2756294 RepID=A0A7W2AR72_9BACL|nr:hypothetical protein [Thermoactinomyces mirandus]MBA4602689.1 hypothetical protein [Thermoactinomyces mirandus]
MAHSGQTGFVVSADAVKKEKDLTDVTDNEQKDFTCTYDVNGNMTEIADFPHAKVKTCAIS